MQLFVGDLRTRVVCKQSNQLVFFQNEEGGGRERERGESEIIDTGFEIGI